jgi:hypothetical protein
MISYKLYIKYITLYIFIYQLDYKSSESLFINYQLCPSSYFLVTFQFLKNSGKGDPKAVKIRLIKVLQVLLLNVD